MHVSILSLVLPNLYQEWIDKRRGWFESLKFWPAQDEWEMTVQQVHVVSRQPGLDIATLVSVKKNGKYLLTNYELPLQAPSGRDSALLAVWNTALSQGFKYPNLAHIFLRFCNEHPDFEPPPEIQLSLD